ncbi:MAG: hypothetical protein DMF47_03740 [Verrucomicrobia bacterium]|nr:MAG: hypothetical protein DMF47_03740 [Verrucomicrobiota bacterium]
MGWHNGDNDDRGLKARNRRWGRIPKAYYTNRRNRPNSEAYPQAIADEQRLAQLDLRPDQSDKEMGSRLNSKVFASKAFNLR